MSRPHTGLGGEAAGNDDSCATALLVIMVSSGLAHGCETDRGVFILVKVWGSCVRPKVVKLAGVAALIAVLALSGCSSWWDTDTDAVRRAVIDHELDERGMSVDDLVVRLSPGEFRADFGHGSRMVWLVSSVFERPYREGEYFRLRDPGRSYLFIQDVQYDGQRSQATVRVVLYEGGGEPASKDLTLYKKGSVWEVASEETVE